VATASNSLPNNLSLYRYRRTNKSYTEDLGNGVKLTLMLIPAGEFWMGAPAEEAESRDHERPQHLVRVSQFLMGRYAVTQAQWRVVAGYDAVDKELGPNPSRFKGDNRPVEEVSWDDAQEFCRRLSAKSGKDYRLPSEAQWEYACRAVPLPPTSLPEGEGSLYPPFHFGETMTTDLANYDGTDDPDGRWSGSYGQGPKGIYRKETMDVGSFPANEWGLHDMHGNVWEWCEDDWYSSYKGAPSDGSAWIELNRTETSKLLRGGSWSYNPQDCRSASRNGTSRVNRDVDFGFRVCCVPPRLSS
jgi:formylglycine-generating enzyme required for sulfatase activity